MFNQGDRVVLGGLDVAKQVVKDEANMNMDGIQSDEDDAHLNDGVVREGETT